MWTDVQEKKWGDPHVTDSRMQSPSHFSTILNIKFGRFRGAESNRFGSRIGVE
jgi:hypothetical protein